MHLARARPQSIIRECEYAFDGISALDQTTSSGQRVLARLSSAIEDTGYYTLTAQDAGSGRKPVARDQPPWSSTTTDFEARASLRVTAGSGRGDNALKYRSKLLLWMIICRSGTTTRPCLLLLGDATVTGVTDETPGGSARFRIGWPRTGRCIQRNRSGRQIIRRV